MSDAGTNFVSDKFKSSAAGSTWTKAVTSTYHHQSNRQVEACIKFIKHNTKKCMDSIGDIQMALSQSILLHWGKVAKSGNITI